jgi:hypothetical protein
VALSKFRVPLRDASDFREAIGLGLGCGNEAMRSIAPTYFSMQTFAPHGLDETDFEMRTRASKHSG